MNSRSYLELVSSMQVDAADAVRILRDDNRDLIVNITTNDPEMIRRCM